MIKDSLILKHVCYLTPLSKTLDRKAQSSLARDDNPMSGRLGCGQVPPIAVVKELKDHLERCPTPWSKCER